jgi:hypothetical protein
MSYLPIPSSRYENSHKRIFLLNSSAYVLSTSRPYCVKAELSCTFIGDTRGLDDGPSRWQANALNVYCILEGRCDLEHSLPSNPNGQITAFVTIIWDEFGKPWELNGERAARGERLPHPPACAKAKSWFYYLALATSWSSSCWIRDAKPFKVDRVKERISSARVIATYINPRSRRSCSALSTLGARARLPADDGELVVSVRGGGAVASN